MRGVPRDENRAGRIFVEIRPTNATRLNIDTNLLGTDVLRFDVFDANVFLTVISGYVHAV